MSTARKRKMTPVEYLAFERAEMRDRHIYWNGEVFAMTGASRQHVKIAGNILRHIHVAFDDSDCEVMQSDMRVKNHRTGNYSYPDVVATCESPKFEDDKFDTLMNPQVVVEVLSKSTEAFDRGEKFKDYQHLDSLKEYVLVSQNKMYVERYTRTSDSTWEYWNAEDPDSLLSLDSIKVKIALKDIYSKVEFQPEVDDSDSELKLLEKKVQYGVPQ